ncbi:hypothetical protein [Rhodococcus sp. NPDC127528]|uniref:hypothetical protein n=1 Tax=unclassified Rhodococcus (in: high G+C Gram-positive bacteria) TaxID=192944 RepID=UPI0036431219
MSEAEVYEFMRGLNTHITRNSVRHAVLRKELRGVRKGKKFLYSKREAIRWMQTDDRRDGGDADV